MKRAAIIVGVVLSVAVVVGAFIVGGGDNSDAKGGDKVTTTSAQKGSGIENADETIEDGKNTTSTQVGSGGPTTTEKDDDENEGRKYEIKKASVQVSPPTLQVGKELKVEVRNFQPGETVTIAIFADGSSSPAVLTGTLKVGKNNHGKLEFPKSKLTVLVPGKYFVTALGSTSGGTAGTNLTVVKKK
jgi:hypothetical protein